MIPIAKPRMGDEEKKAVMEVLDSGVIASGPKVRELESEFARFIGVKHAVAVNSGTAALHAALYCAGIGPGDEVVTSPFTFIATANAILFCGATPVFADIDPRTFNIDPEEVEKAVTPKTKAVLPVHLYGQSADMEGVMDVAQKHNLKVIEDCAQSHGATYNGKKVGSIGDAGCFSFYPTKNMTTSEGGMVTTDDDELAARLRMFINQGMKERYVHVMLGHNFRMTDIAAAIGLVQFRRLAEYTSRRQANAARFDKALSELCVKAPFVAPGCNHVYHQYTVLCCERDRLVAHLTANGVGHGIYYPKALHQYEHLSMYGRELPSAEGAARDALSLPVHPALSDTDVEKVISVVNAFAVGK